MAFWNIFGGKDDNSNEEIDGLAQNSDLVDSDENDEEFEDMNDSSVTGLFGILSLL